MVHKKRTVWIFALVTVICVAIGVLSFVFLHQTYHFKRGVSTTDMTFEEATSTTMGTNTKGTETDQSQNDDSKLPDILYPLHTNITATVFWVGEPVGAGSSENNALSAWDDKWQKHYGCFDDPYNRDGHYPKGCVPKENPFYFDLPYNDFNWETGDGRRNDAYTIIPWAHVKKWGDKESMLKNRWIMIERDGNICYGQWEDAGPYVYDDVRYVFGKNDERPKNTEANNAGMDVSPALRDCLKFNGVNNDENKVSWRFVEFADVPDGPWKKIVTTSLTSWE